MYLLLLRKSSNINSMISSMLSISSIIIIIIIVIGPISMLGGFLLRSVRAEFSRAEGLHPDRR